MARTLFRRTPLRKRTASITACADVYPDSSSTAAQTHVHPNSLSWSLGAGTCVPMTDPAPPTLRVLPTLNLLPHGRLGPPDRPLTRQEHIARYERRGLAACLAIGADPCALRIGEHGSLIGGPDKPLSVSNLDCPPEYRPPWNPLPLSRFTHRRARTPLPGGRPTTSRYSPLSSGTPGRIPKPAEHCRTRPRHSLLRDPEARRDRLAPYLRRPPRIPTLNSQRMDPEGSPVDHASEQLPCHAWSALRLPHC